MSKLEVLILLVTSLTTIGCTVSTTANAPNELDPKAESAITAEAPNLSTNPDAIEAAKLFAEIQENVHYKAELELDRLKQQTLSPSENQGDCQSTDEQIIVYVCNDTIKHLGEKAWEIILENSSPLPEDPYQAAHRLVDERMHFRIDHFGGDNVTSSSSLTFEADVSLRKQIDDWQRVDVSDCRKESNIYVKIACEDMVTQLGPEAWEAVISSSDLPTTAEEIAIFTEEIDYLWYQEALQDNKEVGEFVEWFNSEERRQAYQAWRSQVEAGVANLQSD